MLEKDKKYKTKCNKTITILSVYLDHQFQLRLFCYSETGSCHVLELDDLITTPETAGEN